jgi:thioredoxin 1
MKEITPAQFDAEVMTSTVPVLVDFYTEQCSPCRLMSPILEDIEQEKAGKLKVVKIDAAADGPFTASFRISSVPTFLLFRGGERIAQITGARSRKEMVKWLEESTAASL